MDELSERNVKSIPKLLRAIASGQDAKDNKHDLIFLAAADLIEGLVRERDALARLHKHHQDEVDAKALERGKRPG